MNFNLTFCGVPFCSDVADPPRPTTQQAGFDARISRKLAKAQPEVDLLDELNRILPKEYLREFCLPGDFPGRNLSSLARQTSDPSQPSDGVRVGDWYYPTGATRWGVFRGLATTSQKEAMERSADRGRGLFAMTASPNNAAVASYQLSSYLYLLPPRPLQELGGQYDGLYLCTLVDERYYFQGTPVSLHVDATSTWDSLIAQVASALGVTLTYTTIDPAYATPEPDSQLWTNFENAANMLETLALNVGRVVVRNLDGTYKLMTYAESQTQVGTNRNLVLIGRVGGGDMNASGNLPRVGVLTDPRNTIVPTTYYVTFPKYVQGDDPVPHYVNPRNQKPRRGAWFEQSYGDVYSVAVPIASGGPMVSGLFGQSTQTLQTTAKALYSGDVSTSLLNLTDITALAVRLARDRYEAQVAAALDEVYPGTLAWTPEGLHDVVWTYSERSRLASTRVLRAAWTDSVTSFQHASPALSGSSSVPRGVGGPTVAQTIRDSYGASGTLTGNAGGSSPTPTFKTSLLAALPSGQMSATLASVAYLPTKNRWKAAIDREVVLFEGTSGGGLGAVNIVYRAVDGTLEADHLSGASVLQVLPDTTYGVNLTTYEPAQFVYPYDWTSGGVTGVRVAPQLQTVMVVEGSGCVLNGMLHYSGLVESYDPSVTPSPWADTDTVWVVDRNGAASSGTSTLLSGVRYGGQLVGYSPFASGKVVAPVYATDVNAANPFLAQVTAKIYSGTVFDVDGWFIRYEWTKVADSKNPTPISYSGTGSGGATYAYHVQNLDVPTYPMVPFTNSSGIISSGGSIQPLSIYRMYKGAGDYYLFDGSPFEDLFRRTATTDSYGIVSYHRVYNQNTGLWMDGQEVRMISAS